MEYGYIRVSTKEQHEDRQIIAMKDRGLSDGRIFIDKKSGKNFDRTEYKNLIECLREDDILFIHSIDRLGRNYMEIADQWRFLTKQLKIKVVVLDMPILDTRESDELMNVVMADVFLLFLSYIAQGEYDNIRKRQSEGIAAARAKGIKFGRPVKMPPENFNKIISSWERGEIDLSVLLAETGLTESTFYRRLREYRLTKSKK